MADDIHLGNTQDYHPVRAPYIEVEFIDNPAIDQLLNRGANAADVRSAIVNAMADGVVEDLKNPPGQ